MATDIVMLTHNRLDHLVATVDALEARTRAPYRITVVDNASGPDVRNWLHANRHRFHQLVLRPTNEFLPALQRGIDATTSDPVMLTDPDLIVPEAAPGEPCWLTRMHDVMERHPDFGIVGIGLDQSNLPPVQEPESIDPSELVDGEIVERPVGSTFTLIRRAALAPAYRTPWETCQAAARAGLRVGWLPGVRAFHLGWDDHRLHPGHLASKLWYSDYREAQLIERAPTLPELALAGPLVARTRALGVPDAAVLELTWSAPAVAASLPAATAVERPDAAAPLPFDDAAAGAVVLVDPPAEAAADLVREATRVACAGVVVVAPLTAFDGRAAGELAPPGWVGREEPGPGDVPLALAAGLAVEDELGVRTIEDRERWLELFAAAAFGPGQRRLWIFEPVAPRPVPDAVALDPARVRPWVGVAVPPRRPKGRSLPHRLRSRVAREAALAAARLRLPLPRARRAGA
jgi:hypothetical protein